MGAIIAGVVALGTLIWAVTRLMDGMSDAKFAARRFSWTRKASKAAPYVITDPREAASVLLMQMAAYRADPDDDVLDGVAEVLMEDIARDRVEADGLAGFAVRMLKEVGDAGNSLRKYINPINEVCTTEQKMQLLEGLERLSAHEDGPLDVQEQFLQSVRRLLMQGA
ncbi:MAG: hypothetical protein AAF607_07360 [Pseudomonadota bacterium]